MASTKTRIDQLLVERGLAESRQKAQALLLAGKVLVNRQKLDKPGSRVDPQADIRLLGDMPFVSRAGAKLQAALEHFEVAVRGRVCADLGASTGGFTDCLLQNGAREVHAYDVGIGQIAWKLRTHPRVVIHDGLNVRGLTAEDLPQDVAVVTVDLSFISLTKILGPLRLALMGKMAAPGAELVLLVKPQFEAGKGEVSKGGILRGEEKRSRVVASIARFAEETGYSVHGTVPSPVLGSKGNQEFLMYLRLPPSLSSSA